MKASFRVRAPSNRFVVFQGARCEAMSKSHRACRAVSLLLIWCRDIGLDWNELASRPRATSASRVCLGGQGHKT